MKKFRLHLVLPVQVQIRIESDRHNKIPRYVSNSFKFFYHLIESIPAEVEADTEAEAEAEPHTAHTDPETRDHAWGQQTPPWHWG